MDVRDTHRLPILGAAHTLGVRLWLNSLHLDSFNVVSSLTLLNKMLDCVSVASLLKLCGLLNDCIVGLSCARATTSTGAPRAHASLLPAVDLLFEELRQVSKVFRLLSIFFFQSFTHKSLLVSKSACST